MITLENVKSALLGLAIADALGVPVEFKSRNYFKKMPVKTMQGYGTYHQPAGTWSDDTTMTIATMESIARKKVVDYTDIMTNFAKWYKDDEFTVDGLFDIGNTTGSAITNFFRGNAPLTCGLKGEHSIGNGSLMRILPMAFYLYKQVGVDFDQKAFDLIHDVSALTHAHPRAMIACGIYCRIAVELIDGRDLQSAISIGLEKSKAFYASSQVFSNEMGHFDRLFEKDFAQTPEDEIESTGYALHSLEVAIWCLRNTSDYKSLALKAVNLGGDTDTQGAIAGGLAGLAYGVDQIPSQWLEKLRRRDYLEKICKDFFDSLNG